MSYVSLGDLALSFQQRRETVAVRTDLERLARELSSGRRSDLATPATGDFQPLAGLERSIRAINAFAVPLGEATTFAERQQAALQTMQSHSDDMSAALLTAGTTQNITMIEAASNDATSRLEAVIAGFNTRVADRYAFSGDAVDRPALASAQTMLADITLAVAGLTTAAAVEAAVDDWFDLPGGGFETVGYTGSATALQDFRIGRGESVSLGTTAFEQEPRNILKGFAMAALVREGVLTGDVPEQAILTRRSGELILTANQDLSVLRARIGSAEARIATVRQTSSAELHTLDLARAEIVAVDPYDTASRLEAVRTQLETIYTVTARMSALNLTTFLR